MTMLESALFDEGWQQRLGIDYGDLQWAATGERLTAATFERYRKQGGPVVLHLLPEELVQAAIANPLTMVATDGYLRNGKGHPRTAGTYARLLGRYVRQTGLLTWMDVLRKMALMPAQRLEQRAPLMKNKGRLQNGADADITIFDPESVGDRSTYDEPAKPSAGIEYVLIGGEPVVKKGRLLEESTRGQPIRA